MRILEPILSVGDQDVFFFMRGIPDQASREPMKASFSGMNSGSASLEQILISMLDKYEVVLAEDPKGRVRW
jgi:hypothetical protein